MVTLKELRKKQNMTPPQMAGKLGIALSTYFDKEAGRRIFKPMVIVIICKMFNVRAENVKNFYPKNTPNADIDTGGAQ